MKRDISWINGCGFQVTFLNFSTFPTPAQRNSFIDFSIVVEQCLHEYIFPPHVDVQARTRRLIHILGEFTSKQDDAFISIFMRQSTTRADFSSFMECCRMYHATVFS